MRSRPDRPVQRARSWARLLAPVVALALVAGACGGDDDDSSSTDAPAGTEAPAATEAPAGTEAPAATEAPAGTEAPAEDPLGEANPASGEPVTIGVITEEGSEAIGGQSLATLTAMEMGVEYLNDYQGGFGGRPIELFACGNRATPAGAQDCAQQMVEEGVAAVVLPFDCCGDDQVPIVTAAGIPYIVASGSAQSHLTTPGAFAIGAGYVGALAGVAKHAADQGYSKVVHVVIDVPSATGAAETIGGLVFGNAGVDYEVIAVAPGTPDMTPQLSTAGDAAVMVTGDLTFCTSFNQAYDTLGLDNPKYLIATCIDPSVLESVPNAFEGAFLPTTAELEGEDTDTYAAILDKYSDGSIDPNPVLSGGTSGPLAHLINVSRFVKDLNGDVTAASVMNAMKTATDVPLFLSGGSTATCDGTAVPILPNVCSAELLMATLGADGVPVEVVPVDAGSLFG